MRVSLILCVALIALFLVTDTAAQAKKQKRRKPQPCAQACDCNKRQCCVRQIISNDTSTEFVKKGRCQATRALLRASLEINVLELAAVENGATALTEAAAGGDLLLICNSGALATRAARAARRGGKRLPTPATRPTREPRRPRPTREPRPKPTIDAEAILIQVLPPDVAIATRIVPTTEPPAVTTTSD